MNLNKLGEIVEDREAWWVQSMRSQSVRHDLVTKQQHPTVENFAGNLFIICAQ